jgi:hypothetical protein
MVSNNILSSQAHPNYGHFLTELQYKQQSRYYTRNYYRQKKI